MSPKIPPLPINSCLTSHQKMESISLFMNLVWPCNLSWWGEYRGCYIVPFLSQGLKKHAIFHICSLRALSLHTSPTTWKKSESQPYSSHYGQSSWDVTHMNESIHPKCWKMQPDEWSQLIPYGSEKLHNWVQQTQRLIPAGLDLVWAVLLKNLQDTDPWWR